MRLPSNQSMCTPSQTKILLLMFIPYFKIKSDRRFLRDSRLTLAKNPQEADTQLYIIIEDYKRNVNTRSSVDAGRFNSLN